LFANGTVLALSDEEEAMDAANPREKAFESACAREGGCYFWRFACRTVEILWGAEPSLERLTERDLGP
jgi:hypothetical protein